MTAHPTQTNLGEPREAFMARVRAALGSAATTSPSTPPPAVTDATARLIPPAPTPDLAVLFATRAQAVGMRVTHTAAADIQTHLATLLAQLNIRSATTSLSSGSLADTTRAALAAAGCQRIERESADATLDHHYPAHAGITDVAAAIAESGSLVLHSGRHHSRGTFLVPPIHIALVRAAQVLPDLLDFWPTFTAHAASTVIITGPSKTADIEGILITGIHGPREVHIVLIDDG